MKDTKLINLFWQARKDKNLAVIEGVQALKHAVRFQAAVQIILTCDKPLLAKHLQNLAPDVRGPVLKEVQATDQVTFGQLSPQPPRTKVIAIAKRRLYKLRDVDETRPVVLLEDPRDLENIGAVIRVAAAANCGGVLLLGSINPWKPAVIRGAAGLHYAVPVISINQTSLAKLKQPLISLDPNGQQLGAGEIPKKAVLIFGSERHGISQYLLERSDKIIRLPMKQGVSSLNLATSVAATLYRM